jgi:hypothetical protein
MNIQQALQVHPPVAACPRGVESSDAADELRDFAPMRKLYPNGAAAIPSKRAADKGERQHASLRNDSDIGLLCVTGSPQVARAAS